MNKSYFVFVVLLLICATINANTSYSSRWKTKTSSSSSTSRWPTSTIYAKSRTASSRYDAYRPLEEYRSKYGSSKNTQDSKSKSSIYSENRYDRLGIYGRTPGSNLTSISEVAKKVTPPPTRKPYFRPTTRPTPSPIITSKTFKNPSTSLTHYDTLRGSKKNRNNIGTPRKPVISNNKVRIKGEGYGSAYLEWSEYGIGCTCDQCGTQDCQHFTGICECQPNVIGENCDKCTPDHWGFKSCLGCTACNCAEASETTQCDEDSGNCVCKVGVTGQRCDHCKPGFWDYSSDGCKECTCRQGFSRGVGCDPITGKCSCLPGVQGDNCDGCPYRWVLVDGVGCQSCDECTHALLNTTEDLHHMIQPTIEEFKSAAHSYFLHQKLSLFNESLLELEPIINALNFSLNDVESHPANKALKALQNDAQAINNEATLVFDRANEAAKEGLQVQKEAEELSDSLKKQYDNIKDIVDTIKRLVIGLETGTGAQIEQAIKEAKDILHDMKAKNFTQERDDADMAYEGALETKEKSMLLYEQIEIQKMMIKNVTDHLENLLDKVEDIKEQIFIAVRKSGDSMELVEDAKKYGLVTLNNKIDDAVMAKDGVQHSLAEAEDYVTMARNNLGNITDNFDVILNVISTLDQQRQELNETIFTLKEELHNNYEPAMNAQKHADALQIRAEDLDNMLADTRLVSENALMAAKAYDNIVLAIQEAMEAAEEAKESGEQAVDLSEGEYENAQKSLNESESKLAEASEGSFLVQEILQPQLQQAKNDVDYLDSVTKDLDRRTKNFDDEFNKLKENTISETASEHGELAQTAEMEGMTVLKEANVFSSTLEDDATKARSLRKNVNEAQKAVKQGDAQVQMVEQVVPGTVDKAKQLLVAKDRIQERGVNLQDRLEKLKQSIEKTRELANKIKVGIDFDPATTIELQNPEDLTASATSTMVSLYMKTDEPDGMLLFLGTPTGGSQQMRRTTTDDFMALELDRGYVKLTSSLGAEPFPLNNNKVFVADDKWHKISVDRTGKVVQVAVHTEDQSRGTEIIHTAAGVLPGTYSILNLDPKISKIFVGGIPPGVGVHDSLMNRNYLGQLEDLRINNRPIGLYNFMTNGTTNIHRSRGAMERNQLVNLEGPTGLRFDGAGYAAVTTHSYRVHDHFSMTLKFKTFGEDGLLYIIQHSPHMFMSLELSEGKVIFQYNLGSGTGRIESQYRYNDGKWHHLEATRQNKKGLLKIGGVDTVIGMSEGDKDVMAGVPDTMFFGGFPGEHNIFSVTNDDFNGCIDEVTISQKAIDLSLSRESIGTVPGCKQKVASLVSFENNNPGFIQLASPEATISQLILKFKTDESDGLIFYAGTQDRNNFLTLSLAEGMLILRAAPGGEISSGEFNRYNDSEWHVVIASLEDYSLSLDIDDYDRYSVRQIKKATPFDGPLYFGGVPENYHIDAAASAVDTNFYGCIGDVTLNGKILNLADTTNKPGAMLQKCAIDKTSTMYKPSSEFASVTEPSRPELTQCALPVVPEKSDVNHMSGLRFVDQDNFKFGNKRDARIEYSALPDDIRIRFKFSIEFKTTTLDGIIFYASSEDHKDFVAIYIKDGKITFTFNPGAGAAILKSSTSYNDGEWHTIVVTRDESFGELTIDGNYETNGTSKGNSKHIEHSPPYYQGGISVPVMKKSVMNMETVDFSFRGCLRGFRMNNQLVGGQRTTHSVHMCSDNVEPGIFFGQASLRSHVTLHREFKVGKEFVMKLEVKPRVENGVIMSVHGRRDFVMLLLRNGNVEFSVDNGKGITSLTYSPRENFGMCDGRWHKIHIIKNKNIIMLVVDGTEVGPEFGEPGATSTDTKSLLFLGTQPRIGQRRGNPVAEKYVGCIRNVELNSEAVNMNVVNYVGDVNAGICPTI